VKAYFSSTGFRLFLCCVFCLLAMGCGSKEKVVAVSGTVTMNGEPLLDCGVLFQRTGGGISASGVTDAQGKFTLKTIEDNRRNGVPPGEYSVYLGWTDPEASLEKTATPTPPYQVPAQAANGSIKFTVPASGSDQANFAL